MGFYSFIRDERLIAVSLGLSTVGFLFAMRTILEYYRDEAEVKPTPPKTQYITQDTEDSLQQSTIEKLLNHYNFAIRDTALRIVAGRALNDSSAIHHLLWAITRKDYEERMEALRALAFAVEDKDAFQEPLRVLNTPKAYGAIVRSLELCLKDEEGEDYEGLNDPLCDEYYLRDINERRCLVLLCQLVHRFGVDKMVEAGFVDKWLAKQPWGDSVVERRENFSTYLERRKNRISDICYHLKTSQTGRKALVKAKLITKSRRSTMHDRGERIKVVLEISMTNEDGHNGISRAEFVPRVNDQTDEEQRLRRRHREAMVLNDGTHILGRSDIIEREHDSNT
ncbi:hypothetical protein GGR54DRAFT_635913 [Hypoxylon sp. NC1633]|nr:hypothetical protein GGR54DRAFT_635913 [Hypoxylon sp. NC1633]